MLENLHGHFGANTVNDRPVILYPKAQEVFKRLGLIDAIYANSFLLGHPVIANHGLRAMLSAPTDADIPRSLAIDGKTLHKILLNDQLNHNLPSIDIQTFSSISGIVDHFSGLSPADPKIEIEVLPTPDGRISPMSTDLLIGADGQYSPLRLTVNSTSRVGRQNYALKKSMSGTLENLTADEVAEIFKLRDGSPGLISSDGSLRMFQSVGLRARIGAVPYCPPDCLDGSKFNVYFWITWTDAGVTTEWTKFKNHVWGSFDEDLFGYSQEALDLGFKSQVGNKLIDLIENRKPKLFEEFSAWDSYTLGSHNRVGFVGDAAHSMPQSMLQQESLGIEHAWQLGVIAGRWPDVSVPLYVPSKKREVMVKQPLSVRLQSYQKMLKENGKVVEVIPKQLHTLAQPGLSGMQQSLLGWTPQVLKTLSLKKFLGQTEGDWDLIDAGANYLLPAEKEITGEEAFLSN